MAVRLALGANLSGGSCRVAISEADVWGASLPVLGARSRKRGNLWGIDPLPTGDHTQ